MMLSLFISTTRSDCVHWTACDFCNTVLQYYDDLLDKGVNKELRAGWNNLMRHLDNNVAKKFSHSALVLDYEKDGEQLFGVAGDVDTSSIFTDNFACDGKYSGRYNKHVLRDTSLGYIWESIKLLTKDEMGKKISGMLGEFVNYSRDFSWEDLMYLFRDNICHSAPKESNEWKNLTKKRFRKRSTNKLPIICTKTAIQENAPGCSTADGDNFYGLPDMDCVDAESCQSIVKQKIKNYIAFAHGFKYTADDIPPSVPESGVLGGAANGKINFQGYTVDARTPSGATVEALMPNQLVYIHSPGTAGSLDGDQIDDPTKVTSTERGSYVMKQGIVVEIKYAIEDGQITNFYTTSVEFQYGSTLPDNYILLDGAAEDDVYSEPLIADFSMEDWTLMGLEKPGYVTLDGQNVYETVWPDGYKEYGQYYRGDKMQILPPWEYFKDKLFNHYKSTSLAKVSSTFEVCKKHGWCSSLETSEIDIHDPKCRAELKSALSGVPGKVKHAVDVIKKYGPLLFGQLSGAQGTHAVNALTQGEQTGKFETKDYVSLGLSGCSVLGVLVIAGIMIKRDRNRAKISEEVLLKQ